MGREFIFSLLLTIVAHAAPAQTTQPTFTRPVVHQAKFMSMDCGFTKDPEPTNSPNPVTLDAPVVVDFIVAADGRAYSPFLRQSSGSNAQDRAVLALVKSWRYHPSTCNNVPSDSEAIVVFVP